MKDIKTNIIFNTIDELMSYIINNLSRVLNHMEFDIYSEIDDRLKLAHGEVHYAEDYHGMKCGFMHLIIFYGTDKDDIAELNYPIAVGPITVDYFCFNSKEIMAIFKRLESIIDKKDKNKITLVYAIKSYEQNLKIDKIQNDISTLSIDDYRNIPTYINDICDNNTFHISVFFNDYIYQLIIDVCIVLLLDEYNILIKKYLTDDINNIECKQGYTDGNFTIDDIGFAVIEFIEQTMESYKLTINKIILNQWRERYE